MDRGAWWATVHGVANSGTQLSDEHIQWSECESVLVRWMSLEPVIQSEVSQKERKKYHILMCICGI